MVPNGAEGGVVSGSALEASDNAMGMLVVDLPIRIRHGWQIVAMILGVDAAINGTYLYVHD